MGLIDWLTGAAAGMAEAVSNAAATVISYLIASGLDLMTGFVALLPSVSWPFDAADVNRMAGPLLAWNEFVPIVEGLGVLAVCLAFGLVWGVVRFTLALIPGIR